MNCPQCHKPMIVLEIDEIEADHCVACKGTWLDGGELDLLLEGANNRERLLGQMPVASAHGESPVPCPICDAKMNKVEYAGEEVIVLDKCKKNHGLWFDQGELRQILEAGDFPVDHRIYAVLEEFFIGD